MSLMQAKINPPGRGAEWFVPKFGPSGFRTFVGLLFLPYTAMVLSFAAMGAVLAPRVDWLRVAAIIAIYFFGLGVAAHALDALGSKAVKPWGNVFSKRQLWALTAGSLAVAYGIALFYMIRHAPWLSVIAVLEGFFVFAYNLEWFDGLFHTDGWFAFSWGFLPAPAGYILQTNRLSAEVIVLALAMSLLSLVEITASRPYKDFKRKWPSISAQDREMALRCERILKSISLGVLCLAAGMILWRSRHG